MKDLFDETDDMVNDLFRHLSDMFDTKKNAELIRLAEIEAKIKEIQSEDK